MKIKKFERIKGEEALEDTLERKMKIWLGNPDNQQALFAGSLRDNNPINKNVYFKKKEMKNKSLK